MVKALQDFVHFVREQGVVGLAIGFILGGSVSKLVASFVNDLIQPVIGLIFGSTEGLAALHYKSIMWGQFLSVFIDFVLVAFVVFMAFKVLGLEKLDAKK